MASDANEVPLDPELLKLLASDSRREVLGLLRERRMNLSEIARSLDLNKSTVHEHLDRLVAAGLVRRHEDEDRVWVYYSLTRRGEGIVDPHRTRFFLVLGTAAAALVVGLLLAIVVQSLVSPTGIGAAGDVPFHIDVVGEPVVLKGTSSGIQITSTAPLRPESGAAAYLLDQDGAQALQRGDTGASGIPLEVRPRTGGAVLGLPAEVTPGTYHLLVVDGRGNSTAGELHPVTVRSPHVRATDTTFWQGLDGTIEVDVDVAPLPTEGSLLLVPADTDQGASLTVPVTRGRAILPAESLDDLAPRTYTLRYLPAGDGSSVTLPDPLQVRDPGIHVSPLRVAADSPSRLLITIDGEAANAIDALHVELDGETRPVGRVDRTTRIVWVQPETAGTMEVRVGRGHVFDIAVVPDLHVHATPGRNGTWNLDVRDGDGFAATGVTVVLDGRTAGVTNANGTLRVPAPDEGIHRLALVTSAGHRVERVVAVSGDDAVGALPRIDLDIDPVVSSSITATVRARNTGPVDLVTTLVVRVDDRVLEVQAVPVPGSGAASMDVALPTAVEGHHELTAEALVLDAPGFTFDPDGGEANTGALPVIRQASLGEASTTYTSPASVTETQPAAPRTPLENSLGTAPATASSIVPLPAALALLAAGLAAGAVALRRRP